MTPLYSVVIHPWEEVVEEIKAHKQKLHDVIGWYHSYNSLAHITINLFSGNEPTLKRWEEYTEYFVKYLKAFDVRFNKTGTFHNGAFFLAPDEESAAKLIPIMKAFLKSAPAYPHGKSTKPHISIGRQINPEQLATAKGLIKEVELKFVVDNLTIRKFNPERGQYDLHKEYKFH